MRRHATFWLLVSLVLASPALPAQPAQPAGRSGDQRLTDRVMGFMRMRQAQRAHERSDLEEAVRLYREAVQLGAPPEALRGLARVLERQQRWREAAGAWTRFATLALREDDRDAAIRRREELRAMATTLHVRVTPPLAARQARVWIDHDPPRNYAAGGFDAVMPGGTHRVRVEAPGYAPFELQVNTAFGEPVNVVAPLQPAR